MFKLDYYIQELFLCPNKMAHCIIKSKLTGKMTQWVKSLATKPGKPSSTSETHIKMEGDIHHVMPSQTHTYMS